MTGDPTAKGPSYRDKIQQCVWLSQTSTNPDPQKKGLEGEKNNKREINLKTDAIKRRLGKGMCW